MATTLFAPNPKSTGGVAAILAARRAAGGGGGGGGTIIPGAPSTNYNPASGGIPGVTNPASTVTGNLGNLSSIIGSLTGSQSSALKGQYPSEYFSTLGTLLGNTQRRAAGDISDLLPELQTSAAERAVAGGVSGSGAENTKLLRDIGLTRYGVEEQALKDLGAIQSETPTVRPYDPSSIISSLIDAQNRADLYKSAPVPEAAYQRALQNAGGAGGGGGGSPGGIIPARINPGTGGGGSVDDILKKYGGGMGYFAARGTMTPGQSPYEPAPYGSIPYDDSAKSFVPGVSTDQDFGGSLGYQGGLPWGAIPGSGGPLDFGGGEDYGGGAPWSPFTDAFSTGGGGGDVGPGTYGYEPWEYMD